MPLPSFAVTGNLYEITGAVVGGELSEIPAQYATAVFTPNFKYAEFPVIFEGKMEWVKQVPLTADGNGDVDGRLLANSPGLNVTGIQWHCHVKLRTGGSASFWFDAPDDGGGR